MNLIAIPGSQTILTLPLGQTTFKYRLDENDFVIGMILKAGNHSPAPRELANRALELAATNIKRIAPEISGLDSLAIVMAFTSTTIVQEWGKAAAISFVNAGLSKIPPQIGLAANVESLDLSGNKLFAIPPEVVVLKTLKALNLAGNPLDSLRDLSSLPQLEVLDLRETRLFTLPDWIRHSSITVLDLRGNPNLQLPPWYFAWVKDKPRLIDEDLELSEAIS